MADPLSSLIGELSRLPGIGPKTALKLVQQFGSMDALYEQIDALSSKKQREKLMEIADKCPVHRTLHAEVKVVTREATDD